MKVVLCSTLIILFISFSPVLFGEENYESFALPKFYAGGNPYSYLKSPSKKLLSKEIKCDGFIKPFFGIRTSKEYVFSPTKAATEGLVAVLNKNMETARYCANSLLQRAKFKNNYLIFPFEFDYVPYMPVNLRKGWISGISQGLSLGLFAHLYIKTKDKKYIKLAEKIFNSYRIPIEKGGFVRYYKDSVFFEEYPTKDFNGVFNGSAVAALALWDYYQISKNEEVLNLFRKYIKWLENNISKYEKVDDKTGVVFSYYNLVIRRPEILFRFSGDAEALIEEIGLYGRDEKGESHKYILKLGSKSDDDPEENIYIWADKEYTNWSERTNNGRIINKKKGIYNHSPFYAYLNQGLTELKIEVKYKKLSEKDLQLQIYDGKEYHLLGYLNGKSDKRDIQRFKIGRKLTDVIVSNLPKEPVVEYKYLDDNYLLLKILANISGSAVLLNYAVRWKESVNFVNSEFYNYYPPEITEKSEKIYNLGKECKFGVYGNSLIKYDGVYYLFYNCGIEEGESRISLLSGKSISNLKNAGWIFNEDIIKNNKLNKINFSIVNIDNLTDKTLFNLFFIKDSSLLFSSTYDIWRWENLTKLTDIETDSIVPLSSDQNNFSFLYIDSGNRNKIKLRSNKSGIKPVEIITEKPYNRFTDIAYGNFEGKNVIVARLNLPNRNDINLYIECKKERFSGGKINPIIIEKDFLDKEDTIMRNLSIYSEEGDYYLIYTGYSPKNDSPSGIYNATINKNLLRKLIKEECNE